MNKHKGPLHISLLILPLLLCSLTVFSQQVIVKVNNQPLNSVLIDLREKYHLELSFNDRQLSQYHSTADTIFPDPEAAIRSLMKDLPLTISKNGDVFVISPIEPEKQIKYFVEGQVRDISSGKSLPFSYISFSGKWIGTDVTGRFFYQTSEPPPYDLKVSYLGYYVLDTIVNPGSGFIFNLMPADFHIGEVIISDRKVFKSIQGGNNAGEVTINHHVANFLPGNGDNSVFNLLRLQPGICAAGELANDLLIWGSYQGQSRVLFDGLPLFGIKNFNENISAINPFLVQDIRIYKGGFGPQYGGKVGGIVDITGVEGAKDSPDIKFSLNNLTMNGFLSVPLAGKTSFIMAGRLTYRDLYDPASTTLFAARRNNTSGASRRSNLTVYPDYFFRDINLKLNGETRGGDNWHINYFTGRDDFSYNAGAEALTLKIVNDSEEKNIQEAGSLSYTKRWGGGNVTRITTTYSELYNDRSRYIEVIRRSADTLLYLDDHLITSVGEGDFRIDHTLPFSENNFAEIGLSMTMDKVVFEEDTSGVALPADLNRTAVIGSYITDNINIGDRFTIKPGLRADYSLKIREFFIQPRISLAFNITDHLRLKASAGKYNQYLVLNPVFDWAGNLYYKWTISDNEKIAVAASDHFVGGISYTTAGFEISAEGYLKSTDGLTRFLNLRKERRVFSGWGRSKGADFFIRKDIRGSTFWASWSVGRTEEYFPYFQDNEYRRAPHDQTHEFKFAGIVDLQPFHISGNYVHGSGFKLPYILTPNSVPTEKPYDRFDVSATYRFRRDKYFFDAGLSVLNVFNTENIKYSNFTLIPLSGSNPFSIHAEAVPRMLTVFINFEFGD
jgi:hypothetical protein